MRRLLGLAVLAAGAVAVTAAPASAATGSYSVTQQEGQVLRWNPCRPVPVRVNARLAGQGALTDVRAAITQINAASGLALRYVGATAAVPNGANWAGYPGITLAWASNAQSDKLTGRNAAEGGYQASWSGHWRITNGFVVIDTRYNARLGSGFGTGGRRGGLLMHELGHAVGLNHVASASQMMYPTITSKAARWGSGDRLGLVRIGRSGGCL